MATTTKPDKLSAIQLHLLRFFSERHISDAETAEIQHVIAQYYARKADERMDELWEERGYTQQAMNDLLNSPLKRPISPPTDAYRD